MEHPDARWGLLSFDTRLAGALRFCAWLGLLASWGWMAWRWRRDAASNP